jgi:hypothetical protein
MGLFHSFKIAVTITAALSFVRAQDDVGYDYGEYPEYQDYPNDPYQQEDSLYYEFADREQEKGWVALS